MNSRFSPHPHAITSESFFALYSGLILPLILLFSSVFFASTSDTLESTAEMSLGRPTKTNGVGVQVEDTQICVVMVGLPARGKSLIAQKGTSQKPADALCISGEPN